eukprot:6150367-Alexandrium_andersonii.AAC.1
MLLSATDVPIARRSALRPKPACSGAERRPPPPERSSAAGIRGRTAARRGPCPAACPPWRPGTRERGSTRRGTAA